MCVRFARFLVRCRAVLTATLVATTSFAAAGRAQDFGRPLPNVGTPPPAYGYGYASDSGLERLPPTEVTDAVTDAVGQTPVLVRVELGHVSLLAREWAELRPGDVIRTEQRVGTPVRLRIAGREVARGELVDVEGELGVKITSLSGEGDA